MFDFGFSELMLIAVVALVVIGPERLPTVARTMGHLFGRLQRYVNDVKADISREIELDELRKFKNQFEDAAHSVESSVRAEVAGAETSFDAIAAEMNREASLSTDISTGTPEKPGAPDAAGTGADASPAVGSGTATPATVGEPAAGAGAAPARNPPAGGEPKPAA